jgi:hypothetical protein
VYVLADKLGHGKEALVVLDDILAGNPHDARALASRAVARARLDDREGAATDAKAALAIDHSPTILLQAACAYARLSADDAAGSSFTVAALQLLSRALGAEPRLASTAASDPDLAAIRSSEEFRRMMDAASTLMTAGKPTGTGVPSAANAKP